MMIDVCHDGGRSDGRWARNSVILMSRACSLSTGQTWKLFRKIRKIMVHHAKDQRAVVCGTWQATRS